MSDLETIKKLLQNRKKLVAMLAPSFVAEFNYPDILIYLKKAGFDKIVELTFGAKLVNHEYHKILSCSKCFLISSVCPGIVTTIQNKYPRYLKNLIPIVSPMVATARLCRKIYPKHKIVFISPCNMKKIEAEKNKKDVDSAIDYQELRELFKQLNINPDKKLKLSKAQKSKIHFDKFYNDYTKIYPLAGGLSKTAHINGVLTKDQTKIIDGIAEVQKFLDNKNTAENQQVKFLDGNFCIGGCIGGPCLSHNLSLAKKKKLVLTYVKSAMHAKIPKADSGILKRAKNLNLSQKL